MNLQELLAHMCEQAQMQVERDDTGGGIVDGDDLAVQAMYVAAGSAMEFGCSRLVATALEAAYAAAYQEAVLNMEAAT